MSSASGMDYTRLAKETAEYNRCASAAVTLTDAHVIESQDNSKMWLRLTRSVEDIDNDKQRSYDYTLPIIGDDSAMSAPPTEVSPNIQAKLRSPSGQKMAILRVDDKKDSSNKAPARQVLEIWDNNMTSLSRRIALPTNEMHGKVIVDSATFGRPAWSPDETVMIYAAERKKPDTTSFFDPKLKQPQNQKDATTIPGGQHTLGLGKSEGWGEQMFQNEPLFDLFLVHVETGRIAQLDNVPGKESSSPSSSIGSFALGQCVFSPDSQSIVYTGWDAGGGPGMPKRLGLIYCIQRPSKLYTSSISKLLERIQQPIDDNNDENKDNDVKDPDFVCLTPSHQIAKSPRFAPCDDQGTSRLVYLASEKGFDTHFGHLALHGMDWSKKTGEFDTSSNKVLVKQRWSIRDEEASKDEGVVEQISFPGLAMFGQLPEQCFISRDTLVTSTVWGSSVQMVRINIQDGTVRLARACVDGSDNQLTSQEVLCTCSDGIVARESTVNKPAVVLYIPNEELLKPNVVAEGATATVVASLGLHAASTCSPVPASAAPLCDFTYQVLTLERPAEDGNKWSAPIQCILMLPNQKEGDPKPPLICMPHGGPHSVSAADFLSTWPFFCGGESKYALLLVNYRGSIGFGQAAVEDLPSRIADLDVGDVVHAVKHVAASGLVDADKLGICGGSHGGFLTSHLIGQFPDLFKAACMRNPVTNIASMISSTDIPDWCVIEACGLGTYDWGKFTGPSAEQLTEMYQKSPIAHVQNVNCPTLIALGMKDLRVPPSQGLEYYHILRSRGVATKLLLYDDCDHPIAGIVSKADQWINVKRWFDEHME